MHPMVQTKRTGHPGSEYPVAGQKKRRPHGNGRAHSRERQRIYVESRQKNNQNKPFYRIFHYLRIDKNNINENTLIALDGLKLRPHLFTGNACKQPPKGETIQERLD